ncbi:peptide chain release factor-like protein [Candidatus Peregrinibacteria bacterium]|jgi:peptide chain release factor|nr:peptide chain release factor-like protein [Candidatus Peregrinibacteria bacterium]MBT7736680.1 peptide chain release factor-like protein [Candidatus Peregrinibacteria bacterium]
MSIISSLPPKFIEKANELDIRPEDISESYVTGSGKGGQKVNKTSSCVMLKHLPTGTVVKCQRHREQSSNRISAYKLLILKIEDQVKGAKSERAQKIFKLRKQKKRRSVRAKEKMLKDKAHRGELKKHRGEVRLNSSD